LRRLARLLFLLSAVVSAVSFFQRRALPPPRLIAEDLLQDPVQVEQEIPPPFEVVRKGVRYVVHPRFSYELWGLVVSEHDSRAFTDLSHKRWNDNLNVKDICVIWGRNVETGVYLKMKFRNRDFTCFYSYSDAATGAAFDANAMSNNHLLAGDDATARAVRKVRRGDQIHVRGWLSSYGQPATQFQRGTSTSRTDRGNGACETIYVEEFEILRRGNSGWRLAFQASLAGVAASALALFLF
jgi:hypothetical protein